MAGTLVVAGLCAVPGQASSGPFLGELEWRVGQSEVRVWSAPYNIVKGSRLEEAGIPGRLERLGYTRVRGRRPSDPGEYFWGTERFWIYRRAHQIRSADVSARLFGLALEADGRITGLLVSRRAEDGAEEAVTVESVRDLWLEPELLAESFQEQRAPRRAVDLETLPEHVWRAVLASEDHRFFDHRGLDGRGMARALLRNVRSGKVREGGSTISQQLIKVRELTPKRTIKRKLNEAMRTLQLEVDYTKEEILQAYMNTIYLGHSEGISVYGFGAAARFYFSKEPEALDLAEAATLAAIIQTPNRLSPVRHRERLAQRQSWVLDRMEELEWASASELRAARKRGLPRVKLQLPQRRAPRYLTQALSQRLEAARPDRQDKFGRGAVVWTTIDPWLQRQAEDAVEQVLGELRRNSRRLRSAELQAAAVVVDANGAVLASVGGDPAKRGDRFDRVTRAKRQPGSSVKPFVLLEAFEDCGEDTVYPARRVLDEGLTLQVDNKEWQPRNFDGTFRGAVSLREATRVSLNIPFVRVARHCGFQETAARMRRAGLDVPKEAPPSFVLGSIEQTPLQMARAYTPFLTLGQKLETRTFDRFESALGRVLVRKDQGESRVAKASTTYLVRDVLADVAAGVLGEGAFRGTAFAKSGTSSDQRDAWYVGGAGEVLVAVWVGLDQGEPLGLSSGEAAAPIFRLILEKAAPTREIQVLRVPQDIVRRPVHAESGLLLRRQRKQAELEVFRRRSLPPRRRVFRRVPPVPVIE